MQGCQHAARACLCPWDWRRKKKQSGSTSIRRHPFISVGEGSFLSSFLPLNKPLRGISTSEDEGGLDWTIRRSLIEGEQRVMNVAISFTSFFLGGGKKQKRCSFSSLVLRLAYIHLHLLLTSWSLRRCLKVSDNAMMINAASKKIQMMIITGIKLLLWWAK